MNALEQTKQKLWLVYEHIAPNGNRYIGITSVVQLTLDNKYVNTFYGAAEAERQTGILSGNITHVCKGLHGRTQASEFKWIFEKNYKYECN